MAFPHCIQSEQMDCGPTCLKIISKYYGKNIQIEKLRSLSNTKRSGATLLGLSKASEKIGYRAIGAKLSFTQLMEENRFPCIAHWNQYHYVVIYKIKHGKVFISDPAYGLSTFNENEFLKYWAEKNDEGIVLFLEPTPAFYSLDSFQENRKSNTNFHFILNYFKTYKKQLIFILICMVLGSLLQFVFPFLTQNIVDVGIRKKDIHFIYLILFAQIMLFIGRTTLDIIRGRILVLISNRINISLVFDFFNKLMKLPLSFFDVKLTGDLLQRINDHKRVEVFLTNSSLPTLFSMVNLIVFSAIIGYYNYFILLLFLIGSVFYFSWILFFLKKRAEVDYKMFQQLAKNQSKDIEIISGIQEIKLNNAEKNKLWDWEKLQRNLFNINLKSLTISQFQNSGGSFINELKNILITFITAKLVIDGEITLGMMMSISYIIGQLNIPIAELVNFTQRWQDAKLSLKRIEEIHNQREEESDTDTNLNTNDFSISFKNVSFKYDDLQKTNTLDDLQITIPGNKITAIVGSSGSGKTTLLKLLLKFYPPSKGRILVGEQELMTISSSQWRSNIGVVMQDGFIFSDTIANNIAIGQNEICQELLKTSASIANIIEFIDTLPLGFNTKIGSEGLNISTGQKQRILIARAVYKNPKYLFFDEATSALDANNEKIIAERLNNFFKGRTVIIIAHRLSTVKNADHILVMDNGKIIESGTHNELTTKKASYYELVKNQLELGN